MSSWSEKVTAFINQERSFIEGQNVGICWREVQWPVENWLPQRGNSHPLIFRTLPKGLSEHGYPAPPSAPLPEPYQDITKAVLVYLKRTRGLGFAMVYAYSIAFRRLYNALFERGKPDILFATRADFERVVRFLQDSKYKNIYDAVAHLKVIADTLDKKQIVPQAICFEHDRKPSTSHHDYVSLHDPDHAVKQRKRDEKLPSREAMEAYAVCTNNPTSAGEEILLRVIDLLIATGQRGNEVAIIPYDCWVERPLKNSIGEVVIDANGSPILECGIRYFAEKQFQSRVHWLASSDVPLALRAVERLRHLTEDARQIAKWQEENPGRIWPIHPGDEISENDALEWLGFKSTYNLSLYLARNSINAIHGQSHGRCYLAGDIERLLLPRLEHTVLKEFSNAETRIVLRTSDVLAIAFDGQFRLGGREANIFRALPRRVTLTDINRALGAQPRYMSVFARRNLTEADGSPIKLTSHQPRHWRNTIYHLTGMSDVQQALALGRKRLDQNKFYQHTTIEEDTAKHHDYLAFNSYEERISFLHNGIRQGSIRGPLTDSYAKLVRTKGTIAADVFLRAHATAMHFTPFGGCTHDFAQAPCPKHLQCWNACSHLHLTGSSRERTQLHEQVELLTASIEQMRTAGAGEAGIELWLSDQERKLENMKAALKRSHDDVPINVFPAGIPKTVSRDRVRGSSVIDE